MLNPQVFVGGLCVSMCASDTRRVQIGQFVGHPGVKTLDGH